MYPSSNMYIEHRANRDADELKSRYEWACSRMCNCDARTSHADMTRVKFCSAQTFVSPAINRIS